jgi:aspartyl-tRNA synthetase
MHPYRTHTCGELRKSHNGLHVRLSGWVFRKRDHGSLLFIDLRDHYGVTQIVVQPDRVFFEECQKIRLESVITVTGPVELRSKDTVNESLPTGGIEVLASELTVESLADPLPLHIAGDDEGPEDIRLKYRFLDLRRDRMQRNVMLRNRVVSEIRRRMKDLGFAEFQTPILTCSSPEGARDYLVPSRVHPGKFYALPQAPQLFKQILMIAGFDRYFQIAPCFRDEDARADRSPGEFYQLDMEMSFVTQEDVFAAVESVIGGLFTDLGDWPSDKPPFRRISYREAMLKYGADKPDLRIPIEMFDATEIFRGSGFRAFAGGVEQGHTVRGIPVKAIADRPRSFFDKMVEYAKEIGGKGLAYLVWSGGSIKGPVAKFLSKAELEKIAALGSVADGDVVFFVCDEPPAVNRMSGDIRLKLGRDLDIVEKNVYRFCWVVDFPMYEFDPQEQRIVFSHNPFSMPQGGLEALETKNPLEILAWQYDIVCNGIELSSGAIRNHSPEVMIKAFEIAGYSRDDVEEKFSFLLNAFRLGAPPHGGIAPGVDRIVMLLAHETNIREVIAFPMNQRAQDLMMGSPSSVSERQLRELHIRLNLPRDRGVDNLVAPHV